MTNPKLTKEQLHRLRDVEAVLRRDFRHDPVAASNAWGIYVVQLEAENERLKRTATAPLR